MSTHTMALGPLITIRPVPATSIPQTSARTPGTHAPTAANPSNPNRSRNACSGSSRSHNIDNPIGNITPPYEQREVARVPRRFWGWGPLGFRE
ncbi:hypothetical protein GCM10027269_25170 [Kribbella endophytica]